MRTIMKRITALVLAIGTLMALVMLVSCGGTKDAVEEFLTSDSYTFKAGKQTVKVDKSSVYYNNGVVESYLYYNKGDRRYYYCEINKEKEIDKQSIDSEEYIIYHDKMVAIVGQTSKLLSGFLQSSHMLEEVEGTYTVDNYTIKEAEGVITCTVGASTAKISDVGTTRIDIPDKVLDAIAR